MYLVIGRADTTLTRVGNHEPGSTHEPGDSFAPTAERVEIEQLGVDPWDAVGAVAPGVDLANCLTELRVRNGP